MCTSPSFKHVSTCFLICIFVDFGTSVAFSLNFLIWKKNICAAVFESGLSVHHSWGDEKPNTSFPSHSVCMAVRNILPCTQRPLNTRKSGPSVHPEQSHSLRSSVGVGGEEVTNTNTPLKPINQVALSFITTQFPFSGRNDSLITAEQIPLSPLIQISNFTTISGFGDLRTRALCQLLCFRRPH